MKAAPSIRLLFVIIVVALLVVSLITYNNLNNYMEEVVLIRHSNKIVRTTELVLSTIKDAETGHRGFQLTRDTTYLSPYYSAIAVLPAQLKSLDSLVKGNKVQEANVDSLRLLIQNQFLIISNILSNAARSTLYMDTYESKFLARGKENMDAIRKETQSILAQEQRIFQIRVDSEDNYKKIAPLALLFYTVFALFGVTFLFVRILQALEKRKIAERSLSENVKELQSEVRVRQFAQKTVRNIIDNSLFGIMAFKSIRNADGKIEDFEWILANEVSAKTSDMQEQELIGKKVSELWPEIMKDLFHTYVRVVEHSLSEQFEQKRIINGSTRWFYSTVVKLDDGFIFTFSDITNEKLQRELIEERKIILNEAESLSQMGSWKWTEASDALVWSEGLFKILNKKQNDPISWNTFLENVLAEDVKLVEDCLLEVKTKKSGGTIDYRIMLDSQIRYLSLTVKPHPVLNIDILGAVIDITQRKEYETQLEQSNRELRRSNEDLEQFAYVASHDLQEPLRKIRAFGDRLASKYSTLLDEQGADYILRMQSAASRMQSLIEDLLAFSRVSRVEVDFELLNPELMWKEVLEDVDVMVRNQAATIHINRIPSFYGDKSQVKRVFQNLITNAIKFHKPGGTPLVEIHGVVRHGAEIFNELNISLPQEEYVCISVKDNGIGFDKKYAEKIFSIFQRLHGRTAYEGTGVGLAICRKIVDNHNGYIIGKSVENEGSEFIVIFKKNLSKSK